LDRIFNGNACGAANAAAGDFPNDDIAVTIVSKRDLIDCNIAKLIDQHTPSFVCLAMPKQIKNGGRLADAQKTSDDIRWNHR
jgi:hypothetical protein